MNKEAKKGLELVKEFVVDELSDYGYFDYKDVELEEDCKPEFYYNVRIKAGYDDGEKWLCFKYDSEEDKIYICLGEDNYEEVNDYTYLVKHFWMALLRWEL